MKKLSLDDLRVTSFVTDVKARGGAEITAPLCPVESNGAPCTQPWGCPWISEAFTVCNCPETYDLTCP